MVQTGSDAGLLFEICRFGLKRSSNTFKKETIPLVERLGPFGAATGEGGHIVLQEANTGYVWRMTRPSETPCDGC